MLVEKNIEEAPENHLWSTNYAKQLRTEPKDNNEGRAILMAFHCLMFKYNVFGGHDRIKSLTNVK